jgi:YrbI family 3-deoxy-D-manno-octulosonate 8-phosphate phosphatase
LTDGLPVASDVHTIIFDFDGVFTDNKVWVDLDGREWVCCDRADGLAMDLLRSAGRRGLVDAEVFILSTETNPVVRERAAKIRIDCFQGVFDKLAFVRDRLSIRFPDVVDPYAGVVFLGNDLNDVPLLRRVGWAVAPADAHPLVQSIADVVLPENGGESFVRSFVERMIGIDHMTEGEIDELVSDC